ncbi:MAG: PKD domain-containing protein [Bacillota bacterium]
MRWVKAALATLLLGAYALLPSVAGTVSIEPSPALLIVPDALQEPSPLIEQLGHHGYTEGVNLFVVDTGGEEDFVVLAGRLGEYLERLDADEISIVAMGSAALAARYYLNQPGLDERIDSLVMVSPPNAGSYLSHFLKLADVVLTQEELRFGARQPRVVAAFDAENHIWSRAAVYEALYWDYIFENEMKPSGNRAPTFEHWIVTNRSEHFHAHFIDAQQPVLRWSGGHLPKESPAEGQDLTSAYYEFLAMHAGRNNYIRARLEERDLFTYVFGEIPEAFDVKSLILAYLKRAGSYLLEQAALRARTVLGRWALERAEQKMGFSFAGVGVDRMVREWFELPSDVRPLRLVANYLVSVLNETDAESRAERRVRYACITGITPSPVSALSPAVGPGDLVVELSSAFLPLFRDDSFVAVSGLTSTSHFSLFRSQRGVSEILKAVQKPWASAPRLQIDPWGWPFDQKARFQGKAGYLSPTYCSFIPAKGEDKNLYVEFSARVSSRRNDPVSFDVWVVRETLRGETEYQDMEVRVSGVSHSGRLVISPGPDVSRLHVGVRAVSGQLDRHSVSSFLGKGGHSFTVSAGYTLDEPEKAPPATVHESAHIPHVQVKRVTKLTTLKKEDRTYHVRWEWDFGDGKTYVREGEGETTMSVEHVYNNPGEYRVTAVSVSNKDKVLKRYTWEVSATAGEVKRFTARTASEPSVKMEIEGPAQWVTATAARYRVLAHVSRPPDAEDVTVSFDPGEQFTVEWERPGSYVVRAACTVRVRYRIEGETFTVSQTYLTEKPVEVLARGMQ